MSPEGYSWPLEGMEMMSITELLRSAELSRWSMQMSLEMVQESYSSWLRTFATAISSWWGSSSYRLWLPTLTPSLLADWLGMENVVFVCYGANLPVTAVARGDDSVGADQGAAAHEGAAHAAP